MGTKFSDSTLEIDLSAIAYNYNLLKKKAPNAETSAVVKANAYGLGIKYVAPVLAEQGCKSFFVATLDEAIELRKILGEEAKIYVFHGVKKGEEKEFFKHFIIPVLNNFEQLDIWNDFGGLNETQLPCIIHFDTGMNRLGISHYEADKVDPDDYQNIRVDYVMSHLAFISDADSELNKLQLTRMNKIRKLFPQAGVSLANSAGIISAKCYHFDLTRPGCALYGIKGATNAALKHVITLTGKIINLREVKEDGLVGYDGLAKVKKGEKLAVVPVGYADGMPRILSNNSHAYLNGHKIPLMGRISMDMMIFNVSKVPEKHLELGNEVELIGKNYTVDEIASNAGTIGYEILTSLGSRYKRIYNI